MLLFSFSFLEIVSAPYLARSSATMAIPRFPSKKSSLPPLLARSSATLALPVFLPRISCCSFALARVFAHLARSSAMRAVPVFLPRNRLCPPIGTFFRDDGYSRSPSKNLSSCVFRSLCSPMRAVPISRRRLYFF